MADAQRTPAVRSGSIFSGKPWAAIYPAGVEAEIDIPDITLPQMLSRTVAIYGDRTFVSYYGRDFTFDQIDRQSNQFAYRLQEIGLKPGEPVLVVLPNVPQYLVAAYGILKAGGIVAALNPLLTSHEIATLATESGSRIVVTLDRYWNEVAPLLDSSVVSTAIVTGVQDGLPHLMRFLYPIKYRRETISVPHQPAAGTYQMIRLLNGAPAGPLVDMRTPSDNAVFQFTGGTTGLPKAAVLTHRNLVANSYQVRAWLTGIRDGEETLMAILPFFHAYGGTLCLFLAVHAAARLVLVPRFDIGDVTDLIQRYRPTILPGVPTLYNALNRAAENNPERQRSLQSIRICVSGGAPLAPDIARRFETITGGRVVEGYGLSEASPVTHVNPLDGRARDGSIGLPLPNTEAKLVHPDTRELVGVGEAGELLVRGPQVMRGYWNRPEESAEVLDDERWLHTGDIAIMDEDGYFRVVDRLKDIIITGGENVYPREIEDVLMDHPKVEEVVVSGVKHDVGGEVAKAYIVVKQGETLSRSEVNRYCRERLARYKVPRQIEFRAELPKSAAGKILRRELEPAEPTNVRQSPLEES